MNCLNWDLSSECVVSSVCAHAVTCVDFVLLSLAFWISPGLSARRLQAVFFPFSFIFVFFFFFFFNLSLFKDVCEYNNSCSCDVKFACGGACKDENER